LGAVHICATPVVFNFFRSVNRMTLPSIYMFIMTGASTLFTGWLQFFIVKTTDRTRAQMFILNATIIFMLILGSGAVITMWDNPFAYLALFASIVELIFKKKLEKTI